MKSLTTLFAGYVLAAALGPAAPTGLQVAQAQIRPEFIPPVHGVTLASLPTCDSSRAGLLRRLTDTDHVGTLVQCDGVDSWRAPAEIAYQLINPALPPYNCDKDDTGTVNNACMVVLEDRLTTGAAAELRPTVRWVAKYTITTGVTFDYGANTTALLDWEGSAAIGGGVICNFATEGTGCLTFSTSGSTLNGFNFRNFVISGGSTNQPDTLLRFTQGAAQVTWTGGGMSKFHENGWSGRCQNCHFTGLTISTANHTPDGGSSGEAWFWNIFQARGLTISDVSVEVTGISGTSLLGFLKARGQPANMVVNAVVCSSTQLTMLVEITGTSGLDPDRIAITNNSCPGLIDYGVYASATSGQRVRGLRVIGNNFSRGGSAGGTAGILVLRGESPIISGNQIFDFTRGVTIQAVNNAIVTANYIEGTQVGVELESSFSGNLVEQNVLKDVTLVGIDSSSGSDGGNVVDNNNIVGTVPTTPYGIGGFVASDFVIFGNAPYTLTVADNAVGASAPTVTDIPFQANVYLDNDDPDGMRWDMGNGTFPGQKVTTRYLTSAGGVVKVSGDSGNNCVTLASSGIDRRAEWEWDGADWILIDGPASAGC